MIVEADVPFTFLRPAPEGKRYRYVYINRFECTKMAIENICIKNSNWKK